MKHLKSEFDKLTFKEVIIYLLAVISNLAGWVLLFLGLFLPPKGEIHSTVLTAYGMSCVFVSTLLGISMHFTNELHKFKTSITNQLQNTKTNNTI